MTIIWRPLVFVYNTIFIPLVQRKYSSILDALYEHASSFASISLFLFLCSFWLLTFVVLYSHTNVCQQKTLLLFPLHVWWTSEPQVLVEIINDYLFNGLDSPEITTLNCFMKFITLEKCFGMCYSHSSNSSDSPP